MGGMGGGVADRLLSEGWEVILWNRSPGALERFGGKPKVTIASTPAEAATPGLVVSFVANDAALSAVTLGDDGILSGLPEQGTHISMSSVSPDVVAQLAAEHRPNSALIAAPVFGRPEAAAAGKLWIALSGPEEAADKALPLLEAVSQSIHRFGDAPETALKVKIAGNFVIASAIETLTEAFALLEGTGADAKAFHAMMSATIFGSVIHQNYGRIILDRAFVPPGFRLELGGKDIGLARDMAAGAGLDMPLVELLQARFDAAIAEGWGDEDWNAISKITRG